jgi:hypothetical protein
VPSFFPLRRVASIGFHDSEYGRSGVAEWRRRPGLRRERSAGGHAAAAAARPAKPVILSGAKPSRAAVTWFAAGTWQRPEQPPAGIEGPLWACGLPTLADVEDERGSFFVETGGRIGK